jgi:hypothetical protein
VVGADCISTTEFASNTFWLGIVVIAVVTRPTIAIVYNRLFLHGFDVVSNNVYGFARTPVIAITTGDEVINPVQRICQLHCLISVVHL